MQYIVAKHYDKLGIEKRLDLPEKAIVQEENDILRHNGKRICYKTSDDAFNHFARNDDGKGLKRFKLSHEILALIASMRKEYEQAVANALKDFEKDEEGNYPQEAKDAISAIENKPKAFFDAVHADPVFKKFLKNGYWCFDFFNAEIADLERLKALLAQSPKTI